MAGDRHGAEGLCGSYGRRLGRRRGMRGLFSAPAVVGLLEGEGLDDAARETLERVVCLEWELFDGVRNAGGRASCQDDLRSFFSYRCAQYLAFPHEIVPRVLGELERAELEGRNVVREKYARMMAVTDPEAFGREWSSLLAPPSPVKSEALRQLRRLLVPALEEAAAALPVSHGHARPDESSAGHVSALDYLEAEVCSYSLGTIFALRDALRRQLGHTNPIARSYVLSGRLHDATEVIE